MKVSEVTVEMSGDLKKLDKDLNRGRGKVSSWTAKIGGMFKKLFVVDIARLAGQFISGIGKMLKKATGLIKKFTKEAIDTVDEEVLVVRRLANEIGDLEEAQTIIDGLEESSIKWGIAMSDVWNGFLMGRRLFKEDWITKNLGTIAESSKQLNQPLETMIRNLATVKEGMLSTRKLIEMGLTREMLKAEGIQFEKGLTGLPDKLRSDFNTVVDAIVKIWDRKYVKGVGAGITTVGEKIMSLKNLWGQVMEAVGRSGLYQYVTDQLQGIIDWMAENKQIIFDWADFIGKKLTEAFKGVTAILEKITGMAGLNLSTEGDVLGIKDENLAKADALKNKIADLKLIIGSAEGFDISEYLDQLQKYEEELKKIPVAMEAQKPLAPAWAQGIIDGIDKIKESFKESGWEGVGISIGNKISTSLVAWSNSAGFNTAMGTVGTNMGIAIGANMGSILTGILAGLMGTNVIAGAPEMPMNYDSVLMPHGSGDNEFNSTSDEAR